MSVQKNRRTDHKRSSRRHGLELQSSGASSDRNKATALKDNKRPSTRSLRGLDGLNFLMADVRDGVGPYLSVFLKGAQHWERLALPWRPAVSP
jgi:ribosomal protein L32